MPSNYPPGVTGNEYEIAGPDYEREVDAPCPHCGANDLIEQGYRHERWICCSCEWHMDLQPDDDPVDVVNRLIEDKVADADAEAAYEEQKSLPRAGHGGKDLPIMTEDF